MRRLNNQKALQNKKAKKSLHYRTVAVFLEAVAVAVAPAAAQCAVCRIKAVVVEGQP